MGELEQRIAAFLEGECFAVAGASRDRDKYGNKVLRAYLQSGRRVYAVNPHEREVEGVRAYATLSELPEPIHGLSIVTQPDVTERIVDDAIDAGIQRLWMQPGAESEDAVLRARAQGLEVISGGPCVLVALRYRE